MAQLPNTAMFASRFREASARALLLPRRRPDRRTPLWMQRQRAADLLKVAARYPDFPLLLETTRECLNDAFDVPALREVLGGLRSRDIRVVTVETRQASPFAQSLLFGWIAVYMYEGDAPLAERRAAALALDRDLLRDLLGAEELRELIDPGVLADLELELQRLADGRRARDPDELTDVLRGARAADPGGGRRPQRRPGGRVAGRAGRRHPGHQGLGGGRGAVRRGRRRLAGSATPSGWPCPRGCPRPSPTRSSAPWSTSWPATPAPTARSWPSTWPAASGCGSSRSSSRSRPSRARAGSSGASSGPRASSGSGATRTSCAPLRRRSLAVLRKEVEPVDGVALARFLPAWQGVGVPRRGPEGLVEVAQRPPGGGAAGVHRRDRRPPGPDGRLPPVRPRRPVHRGRGGLGRRRRPRRHRRSGPPRLPGPPRPARAAPPTSRRRARSTPPSWPTSTSGAPRSGPTWSPPRPRRASPTTSPRCWLPCGTWSGRAWSPTTRWPRCARSWPASPVGRRSAARPRVG